MNFLEYPLEFYAKELAIENISIDVHVSPKTTFTVVDAECGK